MRQRERWISKEGGLWDPTLVGERNKTLLIRVWKPFPTKRVLKTLRGNSEGKVQIGQYLLAVGLGCYSFLHNKTNQKRWNVIREFIESLIIKFVYCHLIVIVWYTLLVILGTLAQVHPYVVKTIVSNLNIINLLKTAIIGTKSSRWVLVEERTWPSRANLNKSELEVCNDFLLLLIIKVLGWSSYIPADILRSPEETRWWWSFSLI